MHTGVLLTRMVQGQMLWSMYPALIADQSKAEVQRQFKVYACQDTVVVIISGTMCYYMYQFPWGKLDQLGWYDWMVWLSRVLPLGKHLVKSCHWLIH